MKDLAVQGRKPRADSTGGRVTECVRDKTENLTQVWHMGNHSRKSREGCVFLESSALLGKCIQGKGLI